MARSFVIEKDVLDTRLRVRAQYLGKDIFLTLEGGEAHIGATVQAIPRESLSGDGTISVTSSVLNVVGHKDEVLVRKLAEEICKEFDCVVVCTGGFHMDGINQTQIKKVVQTMDEIIEKLKVNLPRVKKIYRKARGYARDSSIRQKNN